MKFGRNFDAFIGCAVRETVGLVKTVRRLHERTGVKADALVPEGSGISQQPIEHVPAHFQTSKFGSEIDALDFGYPGTEMSQPTHPRKRAIYVRKVEDSFWRWVSADLLDDVGDILVCRHPYYLVCWHPEVRLNF